MVFLEVDSPGVLGEAHFPNSGWCLLSWALHPLINASELDLLPLWPPENSYPIFPVSNPTAWHITQHSTKCTLNKSRVFPGLVEARMAFFKFSNHSCFQPNFISTHLSNPRLVRVTMTKTVSIQEVLLSLPAPQSLLSCLLFQFLT